MSTEEFYSALQLNEYGKQYLELIEKVRSENRVKVRNDGNELHHVHPRALGGTEGELVLLTCYEHCLAHVLLAKTIPCLETLSPVTRLSNSQYRSLKQIQQITLEEIYGWSQIREEAYRSLHKLPYTVVRLKKMSDSHKEKHTSRRGTKLSKEHCKALSESWKGKPKPWLKGRPTYSCGRLWISFNDQINRMVLPEELEKYIQQGWVKGRTSSCGAAISKANKGHTVSEEARKKNSESKKGKKLSEEHRRHISEGRKGIIFSEEHKKHISDVRKGKSSANRGRKVVHKDGHKKYVKLCDIDSFLENGWLFK